MGNGLNETMSFLAHLGAYAVFFTGIWVIAFGDWRKFKLKFAAVAISTSAAFALILLQFATHGGKYCVAGQLDGFAADVYHLSRSIAFILFHLAVGRDAIHFKCKDRRGRQWKKKL